ncbi:hypothetical protein [Aeromonas veronii]|uniref:hypothetical protein n=1 Tax=Aeromonas veronii TaxID=654 RepID=UPI0015D0AFA5|nr:hypothetical protein [Aeromonas veronii]QLH67089.1 hypothetical protein HXV88_11815 [Aeromonas veronii]
MYYFDNFAEEVICGKFYFVAIDSETSSKYIIPESFIVKTSISGFDGIKLSISCFPDRYHYRGVLHTEEEMEKLSNQIIEVSAQVDWKNNSIHSPYNT